MKFGKSLSNQIEETLPEWRDKFLSYKDLKKRLKMIDPNPNPHKRQRLDHGEVDFVKLLEDEMEKFNAFFVEQEEEYVIRLKELQDRVKKSMNSKEEMIKIRKEIVDIHGEMVLLENYSALNYTGLVKILKKYDKRTGALIRPPFIQKVLQQPFFTTDLLYKLVKECERMLDELFPVSENPLPALDESGNGDEPLTSSGSEKQPNGGGGGQLKDLRDLAELEHAKSLHMKSAIAALRVMKEIRSGSSTVSAFSLPPLQIGSLDDSWNKIPVMEQIAK